MDQDLRGHRIRREWQLLLDLARLNQPILEIIGHRLVRDAEAISIALHETSGIVRVHGQRTVIRTHLAEVLFPRFFPSVPIEIRLTQPVFHPNVDPVSGFVCLWDRFYAGDTTVEAVTQLQQIIAWKLANFGGDHLMQPDATAWYRDPARSDTLPLDFTPIVEPEEYALQKNPAHHFCGPNRQRRRRIVD
jgi:hypothetical protein